MPPEPPAPQQAQHSRHAAYSDGSASTPQQPHPHKASFSACPRPPFFRPTNVLMLCGSATFFLWLSASWWTNLSPSLSSSMLTKVADPSISLPVSTHSLVQQQQKPWISPYALVPPPIDHKDSTTTHHHVRVIIRVHHQHEHLVRGLIHNLRFQQRLLPPPLSTSPLSSSSSSSSSSSPRPTTLSMDFALVPTELAGVNVTQTIAQSFWEDSQDPFPHVYAVDLNEAFYVEAAERALPFRCSKEMVQRMAHKHGKAAMLKVCVYDNYAFYQATDVAVREMVEGCEWCTHLLVTNDDNGYHPDFFQEMLLPYIKNVGPPRSQSKAKRMLQLASKTKSISSKRARWEEKRNERLTAEIAKKEEEERKERERGWDVVTCDFTTSGLLVHAGWELGKIDLGGVLLSKQIVAKVSGFIAAMPPGAGAEEAHNADFHFVRRALSLGALATVVDRLLYFHN